MTDGCSIVGCVHRSNRLQQSAGASALASAWLVECLGVTPRVMQSVREVAALDAWNDDGNEGCLHARTCASLNAGAPHSHYGTAVHITNRTATTCERQMFITI